MKGFIFAVVYIVAFATLVSSIPVGFQGTGEDVSNVIPVDPAILIDFTDGENWTKSAMTNPYTGYFYFDYYDLGGYDWIAFADNTTTPLTFAVAAKLYYIPFVWLGHYDAAEFTAPDGTNRGVDLTIDDIIDDATDGQVRYSMIFETSGNSAGGFVIYWNTTEYSDPYTAWQNDELYFLHGVGLQETATLNVATLLLSLLFFQLPDVPVLVNIFLVLPAWASIIYVVWFIVISMIPFLGGG